jgi:chromosome partitioning protein
MAQTLAAMGASVAVIDADPNRPIVDWRSGDSRLDLTVIGDTSESTIIRQIREENARKQFVFVDLEGTASRLVSRAITQADLVLIPLQASGVDARQASRAVALIHEEEEALNGRTIPFRVLLTRTSPLIQTKIEKEIFTSLHKAELPILETALHERQAFKAIFVRRLALQELDATQVNGLKEALENAQALVAELVDILTKDAVATEAA